MESHTLLDSAFLKSPRDDKLPTQSTWHYNKFQRCKWLDFVDEYDISRKLGFR
jgi:hypothetical protein